MKQTKNTFYVLILLLSIMLACNNSRDFYNLRTFENYKWDKSDKVNFEFYVDDINKKYNMFLNLRYIQGFPYKYLHLIISITEPNGKIKTNDVTIEIISDKKEYIGDGAGSYWDLDYPVPDYQFTQKGEYKISIEHAMRDDILNMINEIGISIYAAK